MSLHVLEPNGTSSAWAGSQADRVARTEEAAMDLWKYRIEPFWGPRRFRGSPPVQARHTVVIPLTPDRFGNDKDSNFKSPLLR